LVEDANRRGFLRHIHECQNARLPGDRRPFHVGETQVGWVLPSLAAALGEFPSVRTGSGGVRVDAPETLPDIARTLSERGHYRWRNEAFEEELRAVRGRVVLTGFLSDEDLVGVLAGARCFLYPSLHEGYGFPPLEAMACGTPVVTSATSSLPEVVGDAGLLVDPRDPEAVAGAVERLLGDDELHASLRRKGLERASSYTWDRCAAATVAAYGRAAA